MIQTSVNEEALRALAEFKAYAESTLLVLDLVGTFVFALSGAVAAVKERLDLFGVLVLAFAASSAGGIMRDLLIGAIPPGAISDWRYLVASLLAGFIIFFWYPVSKRLPNLSNRILIFDAAGLALFAVVGTQKALGYRLNPLMAALLGVLSGVGGGILRDILLSEIPTVLLAELYAIAALVGAGAVVAGSLMNLPPTGAALVGAALCFGLRLLAIRRGWSLPVAQMPRREEDVKDDAEEIT